MKPEHLQGLDTEHIKECRNKRCSRHLVAVYAPLRKYCSVCGAKLKLSFGGDTPPIADIGPDEPARKDQRGYNRHDRHGEVSLLDLKPFMEHSGQWDAYEKYLNEHGIYEDAYSVNAKILEARQERSRLMNSHTTAITTTATRTNDEFTCDPDIKGCPIAKAPIVEIPHNLFQTWVYLALAFKIEWIAYLKGSFRAATESDPGAWEITEMYFPPQKATGAHVSVEGEHQILEGTIGAVHSHVGMGAFFSKEDEDHFNHSVELVVNNKSDIKASVRQQLECGRWSRTNGKIMLMGDDAATAAAASLRAIIKEDKTAIFTTARASGNGRKVDGPSGYWDNDKQKWIEGPRPLTPTSTLPLLPH